MRAFAFVSWTALVIAIGACGSSGTSNNPSTGGTSSGGTTGGGGSPTGGASGSGGSGGSGGSSATGGLGGGGVGGSASPICAKLEPLECWNDDCEGSIAATTQQATTGCKLEAATAFECIENDTPFCDSTKLLVQYGSACRPAIDAYHACLQGTGTCTFDGFLGSCVVVCDTGAYAAQCLLAPGASLWDCLCRSGPNVGKQFTASPAEKCSSVLAASMCATP